MQMEHGDPHQQQAPWPPRSKIKVARSRDASDRCWPISRERNVLATQKLVRRLSIPRAICAPVLRSKVKFTKPTNAHTVNAQYLPNGKVYEVQSWYTYGARRPALATSAVTSKIEPQVARSRDASDSWPISRERNVLATPKLVGRLSTLGQ